MFRSEDYFLGLLLYCKSLVYISHFSLYTPYSLTKFEEKNVSFPFHIGISNWEITICVQEQEKVQILFDSLILQPVIYWMLIWNLYWKIFIFIYQPEGQFLSGV